MLERKQLLFIIVGAGSIAILFFVLVIISAFTPKKGSSTDQQPTPTVSSELVIPTSSDILPTALPANEGIQLISVTPPDGSKDLTILQQITMSFSSPMDEKKFYYKIEPPAPTFIHTDKEKVIIIPQRGWTAGKTTITVYEASQSVDRVKLSTPFQYTFEVAAFPTPESGIE